MEFHTHNTMRSELLHRPLLLFALAMAAGIIFGSVSGNVAAVLAVAAAGWAFYRLFSGKGGYRDFVIWGIILFFVVGGAEFLYLDYKNRASFKFIEGREVEVLGMVAETPRIGENSISYVIRVSRIRWPDEVREVKGKVLLSVRRRGVVGIAGYGDEIRAKGLLEAPPGERNPEGFDYGRYLLQSGVSATIFAEDGSFLRTGRSGGSPIIKSGLAVRDRLVGVIYKTLPSEQAGLLSGMLIGYTDGLDERVQEAFSNAGLSHIMAVSGANIAFIILPMMLMFKAFKLPKRLSNLLMIFIVGGFVVITGFSPSVARAALMAVTMLLGGILRRRTDVFTSLALAAIIMFLQNPSTLFDIGFQLSFAATLSLVIFYKPVSNVMKSMKVPSFLCDPAACTIAAQIGVLPITAIYFNKISTISLVSNLLVVPVTELITILGFIGSILGQLSLELGRLVGSVNMVLLTFVLLVTKVSAELPFAIVRVVTPPLTLVMIYYALIVYLLYFRLLMKIKLERITLYAAMTVMILMVAMTMWSRRPTGLEVVFLDVGQGDAAFIRTATGRTVLIDGGGREGDPEDSSGIGNRILIPFLLDYGVTKLDMVIGTHGHDDHIQGLFPVLEDLRVNRLVLPEGGEGLEKLRERAEESKVEVIDCAAGDRIMLDRETSLEVLHPGRGYKSIKSPFNNSSLVLKLVYGNTSILLAGDVEKDVEAKLLADEADLKADVLKVSHHGSITSSTPEFLDQVAPSVAIISVGDNKFGHPSGEVLDRLRQRGIRILRTDALGALVLKSDGRELKIRETVLVGK